MLVNVRSVFEMITCPRVSPRHLIGYITMHSKLMQSYAVITRVLGISVALGNPNEVDCGRLMDGLLIEFVLPSAYTPANDKWRVSNTMSYFVIIRLKILLSFQIQFNSETDRPRK